MAHTDIYERALREEVRRKRVARDYQLVCQYFMENPLIPFGVKLTPMKMNQILKIKKQGTEGPKQELIDALKPFCQFNTCQEFKNLVDNLCFEKELKVRVKELLKYREAGLMKAEHLVAFEKLRFKREAKKNRANGITNPVERLLPRHQDYSLKALLSPDRGSKVIKRRGRGSHLGSGNKKKGRKKWSNLKKKTGKRLLLSMGCTLTAPDTPDVSGKDSDFE